MTGQPAFHLLAEASTRRSPAVLSGALLYDLGRYPVAVAGPGQVRGEVHWLRADGHAATLARLDAYEGAEYERRALAVRLVVDNRTLTAWVYLGRPAARLQGRPVAGGDWRAWKENHGRGV